MTDGGGAADFPKPERAVATDYLIWPVLTKWLRNNKSSKYFVAAMKAWISALGCDPENEATRTLLLQDVKEAAAQWVKDGGRLQPHSMVSQAMRLLGSNGKWINDDDTLLKLILLGDLSNEAHDLLVIVLSCVTDGRQMAEDEYDAIRTRHYYELAEAKAARNEAYGHPRFETPREEELYEKEKKRRKMK